MAVTVSYPGVYIDEFRPEQPIAGAETSIVALLGPTGGGPLREPRLVTSWERFKQTFGGQPVPGFYLWYAARGFFENGGKLLYVVRVTNAAAASLQVGDRVAAPNTAKTIVVEARNPRAAGNSIQIRVAGTQALSHVTAFVHNPQIVSVAGTAITFGTTDEAARFRQGDRVSIQSDPAPAPRAMVIGINNKTVTLSQPLASAANGQRLRLADLVSGE